MRIELPHHIERKTRLLVGLGGGLMAIAFGAGVVLWKQGRYDLLLYMDIPPHLFGGAAAAWVFLMTVVLLHGVAHFKRLHYWLRAVLILGFTAMVTIAWEFFEHFTDTHLGTALHSTVIETLKDMAVGLIGSLPVALWMTREPFETDDPVAPSTRRS